MTAVCVRMYMYVCVRVRSRAAYRNTTLHFTLRLETMFLRSQQCVCVCVIAEGEGASYCSRGANATRPVCVCVFAH